MRRRRTLQVALLLAALVGLGAAADRVPVSVSSTELDMSCFERRHCHSGPLGAARSCEGGESAREHYGIAVEDAPNGCGGEWFPESACSHYLTGKVACTTRAREGPVAAVEFLMSLRNQQRDHLARTGHYLAASEAVAGLRPPPGYDLGACGDEDTLFAADRYRAVLLSLAGEGQRLDCWGVSSEHGLRRLAAP